MLKIFSIGFVKAKSFLESVKTLTICLIFEHENSIEHVDPNVELVDHNAELASPSPHHLRQMLDQLMQYFLLTCICH